MKAPEIYCCSSKSIDVGQFLCNTLMIFPVQNLEYCSRFRHFEQILLVDFVQHLMQLSELQSIKVKFEHNCKIAHGIIYPINSSFVCVTMYIVRNCLAIALCFGLGQHVKQQGKNGIMWQQWRRCLGTAWSFCPISLCTRHWLISKSMIWQQTR